MTAYLMFPVSWRRGAMTSGGPLVAFPPSAPTVRVPAGGAPPLTAGTTHTPRATA